MSGLLLPLPVRKHVGRLQLAAAELGEGLRPWGKALPGHPHTGSLRL